MTDDQPRKNRLLRLFPIAMGIIFTYEILSVVFFIGSFILGIIVTALTGTSIDKTLLGWVVYVYIAIAIVNLVAFAPALLALLMVGMLGLVIYWMITYLPLYMKYPGDKKLLQELGNENACARKNAILECGRRRLVISEDLLTQIVLSDPELDVMLCAYHVLNDLGKPIPGTIFNALGNSSDGTQKIILLMLLEKTGTDRHTGPLTELFIQDLDREVRGTILSMFERMATTNTDSLLKMLGVVSEKEHKIKILHMFQNTTDIRIVEPLIALLPQEPDLEVRLLIYTLLRNSKDIRCIEVFLRALNDNDIEVRNLAAETLKSSGITYQAKETIKEIVKVPCKYCGSLVEVTDRACVSCGAPLNPYHR